MKYKVEHYVEEEGSILYLILKLLYSILCLVISFDLYKAIIVLSANAELILEPEIIISISFFWFYLWFRIGNATIKEEDYSEPVVKHRIVEVKK